MSQPLITTNFLLQSREAEQLYYDYAAAMPIIDYHCHLQPSAIAENQRWANLSQIWLGGDHYKWRAMRSNGVSERYCTGDAGDREKFQKWAETMPYLLRNPLYHWTHLEMARYFGIDDKLLGPDTAEAIWQQGNACLQQPQFSSRGLMQQSNVVLVCTTDDPLDSLQYHQQVAEDKSFTVQVLPTWRPDKGMAVDNPALFNSWVERLGEVADMPIRDFTDFLTALRRRHDFFHACGCRLSDHGIETIEAEDYSDAEIRAIFAKVRSGGELQAQQVRQFKFAMLIEFALMDAQRDWTQQIHYGAMRNNNSRKFAQLGADTGFDSIGDYAIGRGLSRFLDRLDSLGKLPRTIIYNLNPSDNALLATMLGNFQGDSIAGKIQHGSGWWFLDQKQGMEQHLETLSMLGLLSRFVGMLTDSRSFLSYTRHEYFRRILCNMLGNDMVNGLIPRDMNLVGGMVRDICYNNAAAYFGFDLPAAAAAAATSPA